ncbi:MAG: metallophosphoesterase, partial [Clostridia bacterium]|nr:metallophosphoesterase [Clostridia bacterium]
MFKSKKILSAVLAAVLVIGMLPLGSLIGLFSDSGLKVSAQENTNAEKPLLTIGTIGDPHTDYGLQNVDPYIRTAYITAMNALEAEGIDLLLVGGDMTSDNEAKTDVAFRWSTEVYDRTMSQYHKYSAAASATGKTLWACGNHDYEVGALYDSTADAGDYDAYKGFTDMMVEDCGTPISLYTQSMDSSAPATSFGDFWLGAHYVINGFDFIIINSPYHRSTYYTTGTLNWLDQTLDGIGADKTVFITGHYPLYDNRGLHSLADGLKDTNYTNFVNVLNKYDNAIYLYGHEHGGRSTSQLCDTIYSTADSFERITHYDANGDVVNSRSTTTTSFVTAFMGSASFYNYSLNPNWLDGADPEIIQAMTITVYKNRIEFKVINCGKQEGEFHEPLVWTIKRDVLNTGDVVIEDDSNTWELPMDWSTGISKDALGWDIPVMGNWSISGFSDLDTAKSTYKESAATPEAVKGGVAYSNAPHPYIATNHNEGYVQNKTVTDYGTAGWYVNYDGRWTGVIVASGRSYLRATARPGKDGAIVFTAPSNGYYSYSEIFETADLTAGAAYQATIRVNGAVIDRYDTTASGVMNKFEGKVMLKAGDRLMFAFEQTTSVATTDNTARCFNIQNIVVKKLAYSESNFKGDIDISPIFSNPETLTDDLGNVKLMGYDMTVSGSGINNLYEITEVMYASNSDDEFWVALDPRGKNTSEQYKWNLTQSGKAYNLLWAGSNTTGKITNVGGSQQTTNTGSALVFTAPHGGIYTFEAALGTCWSKSNSYWHDYTIMLGDGTVLETKNNVGAADKTVTTIEATTWLDEGEKVIIVKLPQKTNTSCDGVATVTITENDHVCSADTLGDKINGVASDCINDGTVAHYTCYCGAIYGDDKADNALTTIVDPSDGHTDEGKCSPIDNTTHKFDRACCDYDDSVSAHEFVDGYCAACEYTCEHTWTDGQCSNCKLVCSHDWTNNDGKCKICEIPCEHDWSNNNGICASCGIAHANHDWNAETGACKTCGLVHAHDVTADDATCVSEAVCSCGYTYAKDPTNHVEAITIELGGNGDGTHDWLCQGCLEVVGPNEKCDYDENHVCKICTYNNKPNVIIATTNKVDSIINTILSDGKTTDIEAVGPTTAMNPVFDVTKPSTAPADYEFKYLNIYFDENDDVVLRMTFIVNGEVTVTINGDAVTLKQDEGYNTYYLDVTPVAGQYDVANVVTVNGDTYNVSLYSYIKLALQGNEVKLTDAEETLLKALYDLNEL